MKRLLILLGLIFVSLLAIGQVTEPPADWGDVLLNPGIWFASFGAVAMLTAFVSSFFIGWWRVEKNFIKQLISWIVGILLVLLSILLKFGYASELTILNGVIHGIFIGLAANGFHDIPTIEGILKAIEGLFVKKK